MKLTRCDEMGARRNPRRQALTIHQGDTVRPEEKSSEREKDVMRWRRRHEKRKKRSTERRGPEISQEGSETRRRVSARGRKTLCRRSLHDDAVRQRHAAESTRTENTMTRLRNANVRRKPTRMEPRRANKDMWRKEATVTRTKKKTTWGGTKTKGPKEPHEEENKQRKREKQRHHNIKQSGYRQGLHSF